MPGASDVAKDKVRAVLQSFFAEWADTEQGRALLHQAEEHRLTTLIDRLGREAGELEQRAAALRAEQATAKATLARHRASAAAAGGPAGGTDPMGKPAR